MIPGPLVGPSSAWNAAVDSGPDGDYWLKPEQATAEYQSLTGTPREIDIAVADFKCREETSYVDRVLEILRESQERFIAAHKSELDEMAAAIEQYVNG
ncbi:MAG: hypothetical protein LBJ02_08415 [Bifidobacteriaceae bacterium]|jgi:hypothetical protein|nr:hypothetical protein [Bifidobacteriaceae bacterium]